MIRYYQVSQGGKIDGYWVVPKPSTAGDIQEHLDHQLVIELTEKEAKSRRAHWGSAIISKDNNGTIDFISSNYDS